MVDPSDVPDFEKIHYANYIGVDTLQQAIDVADRNNQTGKVIL